MVKKTMVVLRNNATGQEYTVSEEDANKTLSNPLLRTAFSKSKAPEVPAEVAEIRANAISKKAIEQPEKPADTSIQDAATATKRNSPGNDNK